MFYKSLIYCANRRERHPVNIHTLKKTMFPCVHNTKHCAAGILKRLHWGQHGFQFIHDTHSLQPPVFLMYNMHAYLKKSFREK